MINRKVHRVCGGTAGYKQEVKMTIDRKFIFKAVNPCNGKEYTEENALILCAKDKAVIPALEAYLKACFELGANATHLVSIEKLIGRVKNYQQDIECRVPDTKGECERARCIYGEL